MTEVTQSSDVHPPKNRLFVVAAIVLTLIVFCRFVPTYWIPVGDFVSQDTPSAIRNESNVALDCRIHVAIYHISSACGRCASRYHQARK